MFRVRVRGIGRDSFKGMSRVRCRVWVKIMGSGSVWGLGSCKDRNRYREKYKNKDKVKGKRKD